MFKAIIHNPFIGKIISGVIIIDPLFSQLCEKWCWPSERGKIFSPGASMRFLRTVFTTVM